MLFTKLFRGFCFAPDEPGGGAPPAAPAGGSAPAPSPSPSPTPSPAPSAAGAGSPAPSAGSSAGTAGGGTPSPAGSAAAAPAWTSIRDAARGYGLDLSQHGDDHAALQHLVLQTRRAGELQQLAGYGQQYMQHAAQFEQWRAQQAQQQQAQQAAQKNWFKAPEFDPAWLSQVTRDPQTGELKPIPGASPAVVQKVNDALQHQRDFLQKFAFDPLGSIKPGVEQLIEEKARQIVQQQLGGYRDESFATSFVQQHSGWIHQKDQGGQTVVDPTTGRPMLSAWGRQFANHVQKAQQLGITNDKARADYALQMVRSDFLQHQQQQAAATAQGAAGNAALLQQGRQPPPDVVGRTETPASAGNAAPARGAARPLPLADRMRLQLKKAGVTDDTINGSRG